MSDTQTMRNLKKVNRLEADNEMLHRAAAQLMADIVSLARLFASKKPSAKSIRSRVAEPARYHRRA
jgi:hypothetical protein